MSIYDDIQVLCYETVGTRKYYFFRGAIMIIIIRCLYYNKCKDHIF